MVSPALAMKMARLSKGANRAGAAMNRVQGMRQGAAMGVRNNIPKPNRNMGTSSMMLKGIAGLIGVMCLVAVIWYFVSKSNKRKAAEKEKNKPQRWS